MPDANAIELAPSDVATLVPGVTVDGIEAVDVRHDLDPDRGLRTTIWGAYGSTASRRRDALRRLVAAVAPSVRYAGVFEHRVISQTGDRLTLQPVRVSLGLPSGTYVRMRPGVPGVSADVLPGALVLVSFIDRDPSRPCVVAFDDPESPGHVPITVGVNAASTIDLGAADGRVVREGDTITVGGAASGIVSITLGQGTPVAKSKVFA
jgi:hypothetical protein